MCKPRQVSPINIYTQAQPVCQVQSASLRLCSSTITSTVLMFSHDLGLFWNLLIFSGSVQQLFKASKNKFLGKTVLLS